MTISMSTRQRVIERDGEACRYCGALLCLPWQLLTLDHLIPKCKGGRDRDDNLVVSCVRCNQTKGSQTLEESKRFLFPPHTFREQIALAKAMMTEHQVLARSVNCLHCGMTFNTYSDYEGVPCAAQRLFCKRSHATQYTLQRNISRQRRREEHATIHPADTTALGYTEMPDGSYHRSLEANSG